MMMMMMIKSPMALALVLLLSSFSANAFSTVSSSTTFGRGVALASSSSDDDNDHNASAGRRALFRTAAATAFAVTTTTSIVSSPAHATYSAYANREKDWQVRKESGEIAVSNARQLRSQLAEIVPQNNERSRIFCPNGPSAAVSPLMENKCGDRMATPSVFGRSDDVLGNSIPGFSSRPSAAGGGSGSLLGEAGGFPSYK